MAKVSDIMMIKMQYSKYSLRESVHTFSKVSVELTSDSKRKIENKLRFQISDTKRIFIEYFQVKSY